MFSRIVQIINVIAVLLLGPTVFRSLREYEKR